MSFDPENIKRYEFTGRGGALPDPKGSIVLASDYAQLLELYREMVRREREDPELEP